MAYPPLTTSASVGNGGSSELISDARGGASLRSPARSLADRARGLAAASATSATIGRLVKRGKGGCRGLDLGQRPRNADGATSLGKEALDDAILKGMEGHDHEPARG